MKRNNPRNNQKKPHEIKNNGGKKWVNNINIFFNKVILGKRDKGTNITRLYKPHIEGGDEHGQYNHD